jgi:hypothetical protein
MTNDGPDLSSERASYRDKTTTFRKKLRTKSNIWSQVQGGLDTLTYWLTDRLTVSCNVTATSTSTPGKIPAAWIALTEESLTVSTRKNGVSELHWIWNFLWRNIITIWKLCSCPKLRKSFLGWKQRIHSNEVGHYQTEGPCPQRSADRENVVARRRRRRPPRQGEHNIHLRKHKLQNTHHRGNQ